MTVNETARRNSLAWRVRTIVLFTITYNLVEAFIALPAGVAANSSALVGFGLDSVIEVSSAGAVAWAFSSRYPQRREQAALRVISVTFFALAAFVTYDAVASLINQQAPESSLIGIILAATSVVIMPIVSILQRRAGQEMSSKAAVADAQQTMLCTYMSVALLVGLFVNALLGWWWADPVAALAIGVLAIREGIDAWRGHNCCSPMPFDKLIDPQHFALTVSSDCAKEACCAQS